MLSSTLKKLEASGTRTLSSTSARGLRASLGGRDALADDEFHEIFVFRQCERDAADVSESIVQAVGDGEKRRGLIRKNVRATDHRKRDVILESLVIDTMGKRQGRDDLPGFRIFRVLIKLDFLDDAGKRRRGHFHFFAL